MANIYKLEKPKDCRKAIKELFKNAKKDGDKVFFNQPPTSYPCAMVHSWAYNGGGYVNSIQFIYPDLSVSSGYNKDNPVNKEWT